MSALLAILRTGANLAEWALFVGLCATVGGAVCGVAGALWGAPYIRVGWSGSTFHNLLGATVASILRL